MISDVEMSEERHFTLSVLKNFALVKLSLNDKQNYYALFYFYLNPWYIHYFLIYFWIFF